MKNKDHHLISRNGIFHLRYDVPKDVWSGFNSDRSPSKFETLRTRDIRQARLRRDKRLAELSLIWEKSRTKNKIRSTVQRQSKNFNRYEEWAFDAVQRDQYEEIENFEIALDESFEELLMKPEFRPLDQDEESYRKAQEKVRASPEGKEIIQASKVLSRKLTPIRPLADEWLQTKRHLNTSTLYRYDKAISTLLNEFTYIEDVTVRKAKKFLSELLEELNPRTVKGYCGAFKGVWEQIGLPSNIWSIKGMASSVESVVVLKWINEEYWYLLNECQKFGRDDLYLAIRIAAHTGAGTQGVARLEVRDEKHGRSLFLNETKRETRPRIIPCHPEIYRDVEVWQNYSFSSKSLSRQFTAFKQKLGFKTRSKVFHSFRHGFTNKLENARVMDREIQRLMGHKIGTLTFDTYNVEGLEYHILEDVIRKVDWSL
ncbi:hypothetical protein GCM10008927_19910 [Amylibacter ulvae]|uniref:Core-binding (CB) domain-containing protein n=1 Tax=Paramylibacter ulvae TaxID=1651968 RepID=A0ABQ3D327_9RHOB|nr:DUF6538 domain-containing protein [Amylibacter ulvae]GHA54146.1 hypothetical protein GCM10008927_19910 [Amylibacter ulvae]